MRSIIILPIVLIILSKFFGEDGIWISRAVSEFIILLIVGRVFKLKDYTEKSLLEVV